MQRSGAIRILPCALLLGYALTSCEAETNGAAPPTSAGATEGPDAAFGPDVAEAGPPAADVQVRNALRKALGVHGAGKAGPGFFRNVLGHELKVKSLHVSGGKWTRFLEELPRKIGEYARRNAEKGNTTILLLRILMKSARGKAAKGPAPPTDPNADPNTLAAGAAGRYDRYWEALGQELDKMPQELLDYIVLRPGHEMTGTWFTWSTRRRGQQHSDPELSAAFKAYWRRIHDKIHGRMNGKKVRWDFNYSGGQPIQLARDCYPGDDCVDIISLDIYASARICRVDGRPNAKKMREVVLDPLLRWAREHGKMVGIGETSVVNRAIGKGLDPEQDGAAAGRGGDDYVEWFEAIADWSEDAARLGMLSHVILFDVDNKKGTRSVLYRDDANPYAVMPGREDWTYRGYDGRRYPTNNPRCAEAIVRRFGGPAVGTTALPARPGIE